MGQDLNSRQWPMMAFHTSLNLSWWRHQMETFSTLLALCAGNSPATGEFTAQRPVTPSFDSLFDLRLNQQLSKQWRRRWFETPSRSLWRHCNNSGFNNLPRIQSVPNFLEYNIMDCRCVICQNIYVATKGHYWRSHCINASAHKELQIRHQLADKYIRNFIKYRQIKHKMPTFPIPVSSMDAP